MKTTSTKWMLCLALSASLVLASACGKNNNEVSPGTPATSEATSTPDDSAAESIDPFAKYDPPIEVTAVRDLPASILFREGENIDNNVWSREYEEKLGIKIKYLWTSNSDYSQRLNVSITSGDLPDIFPVDAVQLKQLVDAGQVEDLTEVFEKYVSPEARDLILKDPNQMKSATFDGKLMALPRVGSPYDSSQVLWIRADWLRNLNIPEPKTLEDVVAIAAAFTTQDPDQNSKDDTYGFALTKDLHKGGFANIQGFLNGFNAYVGAWIQGSDGKLTFGSVQPEIKNGLAKLQEMYKAGYIDEEFAVKDGSKVMEDLVSGKIGLSYGAWWNPAWPLQTVKDQDPTAEWKAYGIPALSGTTNKLQLSFPVAQYYVVKKGAKNTEAIIKLLNILVENGYSKNANIEKYFIAEDGFLYNNYPLVFVSPADGNVNIHLNMKPALENKDDSKLTGEEKGYYEKIMAYRAGDPKSWTNEGMYGLDSAWPFVKEKIDADLIQHDQFFGAPTPTMSQKNANLDKMLMETFTKIIMGEVSVDEFDKFVSNWNKLGGSDITNEVNEWAAAQ
ncbi:hypothetical protein PAT3040_00222 [Paenibacillus agaridevorans]|uniref:ABC transporter substrate-binding protein n=1 Tax=Paenibacillus agaridevorans TaxID=171404 RepID=A0A2R5EGU3_9BACL|nr:extracellular solute-binding protein [Paenibacillus agaridevorans]GBG05737.1 hypothetical protein PAT3040_00222 [Paenibacillus agaridevorans]